MTSSLNIDLNYCVLCVGALLVCEGMTFSRMNFTSIYLGRRNIIWRRKTWFMELCCRPMLRHTKAEAEMRCPSCSCQFSCCTDAWFSYVISWLHIIFSFTSQLHLLKGAFVLLSENWRILSPPFCTMKHRGPIHPLGLSLPGKDWSTQYLPICRRHYASLNERDTKRNADHAVLKDLRQRRYEITLSLLASAND